MQRSERFGRSLLPDLSTLDVAAREGLAERDERLVEALLEEGLLLALLIREGRCDAQALVPLLKDPINKIRYFLAKMIKL